MAAAKTYLKCERVLVDVLRDQDVIKGYYEFGASSLYDYAHRILELPEYVALDMINIARKSHEVPELAMAVVAGEISVTKARRITSVITRENKSEWIQIARTKSKREVEKAVKTLKPELAVRESARFVAADRLEVKCGLSEEAFDKLKRVMDLESQRTRKIAKQEDAIVAALDAYLFKHDPLLKAERARDRAIIRAAKFPTAKLKEKTELKEKKEEEDVAQPTPIEIELGPGQVKGVEQASRSSIPKARRETIPSVLRHAVYMRDGGQCTFRNDKGERCASRRWIDTHHIVGISEGGTNAIENLTTLCSSHHRLIHWRGSNLRRPSEVKHGRVSYH